MAWPEKGQTLFCKWEVRKGIYQLSLHKNVDVSGRVHPGLK